MKRNTKYRILIALAATLIVFTGAVCWLLGTTAGAKWLIGDVSRFTTLTIEAKEFEGRLWGALHVKGLRVSWPEGSMEAEEIVLRWRPGLLIFGQFAASELLAEGVTVRDNRPESRASPSRLWPMMSGSLVRLNVRIDRFSLHDITYRRRDEMPVVIRSLFTNIRLHEGTLTAHDIRLTAPQFSAGGSVTLGLTNPYLELDGSLVPLTTIASMDRFLTKARIRAGRAPAEAEGSVEIAGMSGTAKTAELAGNIRIMRQSLGLNGLRLSRPGLRGSVNGEGELVFSDKGPLFRTQLFFAGIDLSRELPFETDLSGTLAMEGSMQTYQGSVSLSNRGTGWRTAALDASFHGTPDELVVTSLKGKWLAGTLEGRTRFAWKKGLSLETALKARGLDPAGFAPQLAGIVNMDLDGAVRWTQTMPEGELTIRMPKSRIHGQVLNGELTARLKRENINIDSLSLRGRGFEVTAHGDLEKRINVAARFSDLSRFLSGVSGSVSATGIVRRSKGRIAGEATAHGSDLMVNGVKASSSEMSVHFEGGVGGPLAVKASLRDVTSDMLRLEAVTLDAAGTLPSGKSFELSGNLSASRGSLRHRTGNVELMAELNRADLSWTWRGESINGRLSVVLAKYGRLDTSFLLPLPARFPFSFNRNESIDVSLKGDLQEMGTLSYLFPGLVQNSRGRLVPDIRVKGTLTEPYLQGSLVFDKGDAYLPSTGIRVTDVHIQARLEHDRIQISLSARSGPGSIEAKAVVIMDGVRLLRYQGSLTGERFQVLYLPEMSVLCSPSLKFEGTEKKVTLRGEVRVPELLATGPPKETAVQPSEDVVIIGAKGPVQLAAPYAVDVQIKVTLGESVVIKAKGVDAQLGGEVLLSAKSVRVITGTGEITVVKGSYKAYGMNLAITRGKMLFAGGPVDNPALDILALRKTAYVMAGVRVGGFLQKPTVSLYSEPSMPDADVLSYMVLGHPLGQDKAQADSLMQAAAVLLSSGQNASLRDELRRRLGIDTIEIQGGEGGVSQSVVTVGKYLSPDLYVSYGRSLSGENLFRLRYEFSKHWELETKTGEESALDLYYTIRFD